MTTNKAVAYKGPGRVEVLDIDYPTFELKDGLMTVTDPGLAGHDGMVFVYPEDSTGGYWMRNTPMPLSIVFVDAGGRIVSTTDMAIQPSSPRMSGTATAFAYMTSTC